MLSNFDKMIFELCPNFLEFVGRSEGKNKYHCFSVLKHHFLPECTDSFFNSSWWEEFEKCCSKAEHGKIYKAGKKCCQGAHYNHTDSLTENYEANI